MLPSLGTRFPNPSQQKSVKSDETMGSHIATSYAQYGGWNYVQGGRHTNTGNTLPCTTTITELEDLSFYLPREFELKTAFQVACCG
jgi:hypothetical protein